MRRNVFTHPHRFGMTLGHALLVCVKNQVDSTEINSVMIGLTVENVAHLQLRNIAVRMPRDDHIQFRKLLRNRAHLIGMVVPAFLEALMTDEHDHHRARFLHRGNDVLQHRNGIGKLQSVNQPGSTPVGNARRVQSDDAHLHAIEFANHVRLYLRQNSASGSVLGIARRRREDVGIYDWHLGLFSAGREFVQPPIELVITPAPRVVLQEVQRLHHHLAVTEKTDRRALDGVARIDQQSVRLLLADLLDDRRATRHPADIRVTCIIFRRQNVPVQIRRGENADRNFAARRELAREKHCQRDRANAIHRR